MANKLRTVICLLRNDLRYHDNEVLHWANQNADYVLPLYCLDPRHYHGTWHFSFPKTGPHRLKFLLQSLQDLKETLQQVGSDLVISRGKPESVIQDLVRQLGKDNVKAVALQEEATREELDVEAAIAKSCQVPVQKFWGSTLYHRDDIPFRIRELPNVFTEFRKKTENQSRVRPTFPMPSRLNPLPPGIDPGLTPSMEDMGMAEPVKDDRSAFPYSGGERQALTRIQHYFWDYDYVATYKETRNGLIGADYSTKFSSWLALGCLSPRRIYEEIKKYEKERRANQSTYWVLFELLWRDYFKFVALKFGDRLFYLSGLLGNRREWRENKALFDAWREGQTGVPFVDANMRELAATGFMSNRGRQNVASFLTKDLKLDWRLGAEWFEHLLIDHDVCSNYGNWLYCAGVGNDPRQDRKFNMIKQGLDYDAQGDYVRLWVPELQGIKGGAVHTPWALSSSLLIQANVRLGHTYPMPIVKSPEWGKYTGSQERGKSGKGPGPRQQTRGLDFYFSSAKQRGHKK
ncbi:cryptochrome DASH-like [Acanthaster planci]|uniref:Cryptochrome DASH n=1 Tax=Acanthaster planci TaxID=133434 RepID=A0A8B7ZNI7_ACAPL|nr:cryptochrome DASH-like [Acanthaster planci]